MNLSVTLLSCRHNFEIETETATVSSNCCSNGDDDDDDDDEGYDDDITIIKEEELISFGINYQIFQYGTSEMMPFWCLNE